MSNAQLNNTNPTDKESSANLRITKLEGKMISVQNQLTHTVTKADLQKAIAPLATKADLAALAERTDKSIRELRESIRDLRKSMEESNREFRESMRDLGNGMWKVIAAIAGAIMATAAVVALIIKFL